MTEGTAKFFLLQVNDALFPIGGYSHSYGLETYIQKGVVHDEDSAEEFIHKRLKYNFLYNEFMAVRLGWEYAVCNNLDAISELEEIMEAGKIPRETREASRKLGSRFIKTLSALELPMNNSIFEKYRESRKGKSVHHAVAYGVFCGAAGITREEALEHFIYAQTSAMVTNCVKTIPLSQSVGQKLLSRCFFEFQEVLETLKTQTKEDLCLSAPGFDIRGIQHEKLYSRLYMS